MSSGGLASGFPGVVGAVGQTALDSGRQTVAVLRAAVVVARGLELREAALTGFHRRGVALAVLSALAALLDAAESAG